MRRRFGPGLVALLVTSASTVAAAPLGTAFTYQGRLTDAGGPASGVYDLQFTLYDAATGGAPVGTPLEKDDVSVTDGMFTVSLDFGAVFGGSARWLAVGVRPGGSAGPFTPLSGRQELTPSPGALYALAAPPTPWLDIPGKPGGFSDDVDDDALGALGCASGELPVRGAGGWTCAAAAPPAAGSIAYIQNQSTASQPAAFNISGSAEVGGGLKLGTTASACDATLEGTLRYSAAAKEVEFCDGTAWKTLATRTPVIWSGGCTSHGTTGGWNLYCLNGVDFNTAAGHLGVNPNGTVTFLRDGYYRIAFWAISYGNGYGDVLFKKNGVYFYYGHNIVGTNWSDNFADQTWPFAAGDTLTVEVYNPGLYAYHSWNPAGAHSRLQIRYEGPLP